MSFDPFQSRLCRNIRNELSKSLMETIQRGDIAPSYAAAEKYLSEGTEQFITDYINDSITRFKAIIYQIQSAKISIQETYAIALLLWDQELFFEVHEWFEKNWVNSKGTERIILQALIRAAGAYLYFQHGRNVGAKKLASKAVENLMRHKELVPIFFNVDMLIAKLKALDPVPPKLGATRLVAKRTRKNSEFFQEQ